MKKCTRCGELKPANTEYFNRQPSGKNGITSWCKPCQAAYSRSWYQANREKRLKQTRQYQREHPEVARKASVKWRKLNPDKVKEGNLKRRAENREDRRQRTRDFTKANPGYLAKWRKANRAKSAAAKQRRRARKNNAEGTFAASDVELQRKGQDNNCWWCAKAMKDDWTVDHVVPLSKGGSNYPSNIVLCHMKCNSTKGTRSPAEAFGRLL